MEKLKHPYIESYLNCAAVLLEHADSLPGALLQVRIHETFAEDTALIIVTRSTGCWPASWQVNAKDGLLDWHCGSVADVGLAPKVMEYAGSGDLRQQVGGRGDDVVSNRGTIEEHRESW